jgi:transposase-like protein
MPITPTNPFKGRHFPGEVILLCVRWYLRYPLAYEHVAELLAERGVEVDPSCIWRWVQAFAPELNKRCRPHLKPTNKSYRTDETYIKVKGEDKYLYRAVDSTGQTIDFLLMAKRDAAGAKRFFRKVLSSPGNGVPRVINVDKNPAYPAAVEALKEESVLPPSGSSPSMQVSEQCCGARPSHGEEADVAGERVRLILNGWADLARNRSRAYDSEGQSEMGGERGCNRAGHFHCQAVWHRRLTPKSIEQPPMAVGARSTEFRNEARVATPPRRSGRLASASGVLELNAARRRVVAARRGFPVVAGPRS